MEEVEKSGIKQGSSFLEKFIGTNAVDLCLRLGQSVYVLSNQNYCELMRKWNCYAIKLNINGGITGCLALFMDGKLIKKEEMGITELLGYKIHSEITKIPGNNGDLCRKIDIKLSDKQIVIMGLMSKGLTDIAIANELNLSISTVKYHKSKIFKKLNVGCSLEAIVKAYRMKILLLD